MIQFLKEGRFLTFSHICLLNQNIVSNRANYDCRATISRHHTGCCNLVFYVNIMLDLISTRPGLQFRFFNNFITKTCTYMLIFVLNLFSCLIVLYRLFCFSALQCCPPVSLPACLPRFSSCFLVKKVQSVKWTWLIFFKAFCHKWKISSK